MLMDGLIKLFWGCVYYVRRNIWVLAWLGESRSRMIVIRLVCVLIFAQQLWVRVGLYVFFFRGSACFWVSLLGAKRLLYARSIKRSSVLRHKRSDDVQERAR